MIVKTGFAFTTGNSREGKKFQNLIYEKALILERGAGGGGGGGGSRCLQESRDLLRLFNTLLLPATGWGLLELPLKLFLNRSWYGHQNHTEESAHHFQQLGITWLAQWRNLTSLWHHIIEFADKILIPPIFPKYLNSKVSDNIKKLVYT